MGAYIDLWHHSVYYDSIRQAMKLRDKYGLSQLRLLNDKPKRSFLFAFLYTDVDNLVGQAIAV